MIRKPFAIAIVLIVSLCASYSGKGQTIVVLSLADPCQALQITPPIKAPEKSFDFSVFPNPAREQITLTMELAGKIGLFTLRITDLTGVVVAHDRFFSDNHQWVKVYNIGELAAGTYVVSIIRNNEVVSKMVIVR
jgi:predicted nicotinamide N-methyase